ncbi:hypothetical protein A5886_001798 [Enterococcus sp. 8G7_MSG3316]|uniref:Phage minor structural protein n=1 Tax=Candidatus Enterococcus testudinis TaxID=1834191 RepID=A0A242A726_9ENTE|nr:phage tail protein [Enterococcus sp. 8G7_MSG3316]OTN76719.1 hypothetical protein A5886_001798 [Enterococcus sp. 8G7_MSG3316]
MLIIRNYEKTAEELLVHYDKASFYEEWLLNETWEIGFLASETEKSKVSFELLDYESSVFWQGQEFIIKEITPFASGEKCFKLIVATHVYYTLQDGYQYETLTGRRSPSQLLAHIFKDDSRNFSWSIRGSYISADKENFGDANYIKLINEILKIFPIAMIPDNRRLSFIPLDEFGKKINEPIRYKYNTDDVRFVINTYNLKTQIMGFGARQEDDESKYVFNPITYTSPESQKWGIRIQDPVRDERYQHADSMEERLRTDLQDYPEITGIVTLKWKTELEKGDYVPFIYEPMGINTYIQVVGIKTFPDIPNKPPEIVLSNTKQTMTKLLISLRQEGLM